MVKYKLTPDLMTGNTLIDTQHKELLDAVNALTDACSSGNGRDNLSNTIQFLVDYVNKHFSDEEMLQMRTKYPNIDKHRAFHRQFKEQLAAATLELREKGATIVVLGKLNTVVASLLTHIRMEDVKLAKHIKENG